MAEADGKRTKSHFVKERATELQLPIYECDLNHSFCCINPLKRKSGDKSGLARCLQYSAANLFILVRLSSQVGKA
jgi:hypothetical protein